MFEKFTGADKNFFNEFEQLIGFELPADYSNFLLYTYGGTFKELEDSFLLKNIGEQIFIDCLFGFREERSLNLCNWYKEYELELPQNTIIIGNTYGAGLIILIWDENAKGVYLWDDSLELEQSTEECCTYKITETFEDFMNLLNIN